MIEMMIMIEMNTLLMVMMLELSI